MKVTVEIIMGRFIDTEVSEDATVKELKKKIAMEVKFPVKCLILVVGDDETRRIVMDYENEMMLRDLGVNEYSHLYLFFKNTDLVAREERFRREGDDNDDPMEEISSEAESRRRNEEEDEELGEEEKVKISNEKEDEEKKDEKEDGDEKAEDEEEDEKLNNRDEAKDNDDVEEDKEGDNKEENLSRVS